LRFVSKTFRKAVKRRLRLRLARLRRKRKAKTVAKLV
jgi:hypothetical protein